MYYDDSNRHDKVKQQLNMIQYFYWTYYLDEIKQQTQRRKQNNWIRNYFYWIYCIKCDINKGENRQPIRTTTDNDILSYFYKIQTTKDLKAINQEKAK